MTSLHIQKEMTLSLAATEGLVYVASSIFGGGSGKNPSNTKNIDSADSAMDFARMINGGG